MVAVRHAPGNLPNLWNTFQARAAPKMGQREGRLLSKGAHSGAVHALPEHPAFYRAWYPSTTVALQVG